ncbi:ABC transporter substrate-binding protein [Psychrobacillus sp.]|uniref:ABC transporter substrate-binding protein n=1 Tax=Psychrobacillus sp. TaxID=1871623 RepID=UPI0028BED31D|nr:ABC transporter substrate-binding protein [Psychrobacillus sp.]
MKKVWNKSLISVGLLAIFLLILSACSSDGSTSEKESEKGGDPGKGEEVQESTTPVTGGKISIGLNAEPDTLDMHKTGMALASIVGSNLGAALLAVDPETQDIKPHMAESYEVSEDGKTLTFKLHSGITFHDGTALTAQAYKDTFDRAMNPDTGAVVAGSLLSDVQEVTAQDELTLVIELKKPSAPFLVFLASGGYLQPLSMAAIEQHGENYGKNPVGVGPWKFNKWETGQSILLSKNEAYKWPQYYYENRESPYPDELEFKFITDYQTKLAALDTGSIDIALYVEAKDIQRYRDNDKFEVKELERQGLGLLMEMNTENEKLQDPNIRKALNMAIDKSILVQAILAGEGTVVDGPLSSNFFGYDPEVENYGYKYNQDEAIKLLESSGWSKNGKGIMEKNGKELSLELLTTAATNQQAQIIQAMTKEIGISIEIQSMESATLIEKAGNGEFDLAFLSYAYSDPDILLLLFHSSQGALNHTRANNPELDALLEQGRTEMDLEKRKELYIAAQKIIVKEAYWVPIYTEKVFHVINKRVHGVKNSATDLLFHDSWVEQ